MKKIYSSAFQEIYYDVENSIIKNIWLPDYISFEQQKEELRNWMTKFNELKPKYMLTNGGSIIVPPEVQDWIIQFLFPTIIEKGVSRYAILLPNEFYSKLSVEQMFSEDKEISNDEFQQCFFPQNKEQKALDWLKG